jgi:hypothetical protein
MPNHSGDVEYPVSGDTVIVRIAQGGVPYLDERYRATDIRDEKTGMPKHRFVDHPYLRKSMPGDRKWFGLGGSFLELLRGGITKIGASPLCQLIFIKFENVVKLISQQWDFMSCGLRAYSRNDNGNITTRFSFFRKDSWGYTHDDDWSLRSDYDVLIDDNGMQFLCGPVKKGEWLRKDRTMVRIHPTGVVFIAQGKIDENKYRQTYLFTPDGKFVHEQYDEEMKVCTYHKEIVQCGEFTKVDERIVGSYKMSLTGKYTVHAEEGVYHEGAHIRNKAEMSIVNESHFFGVEAQFKNI